MSLFSEIFSFLLLSVVVFFFNVVFVYWATMMLSEESQGEVSFKNIFDMFFCCNQQHKHHPQSTFNLLRWLNLKLVWLVFPTKMTKKPKSLGTFFTRETD